MKPNREPGIHSGELAHTEQNAGHNPELRITTESLPYRPTPLVNHWRNPTHEYKLDSGDPDYRIEDAMAKEVMARSTSYYSEQFKLIEEGIDAADLGMFDGQAETVRGLLFASASNALNKRIDKASSAIAQCPSLNTPGGHEKVAAVRDPKGALTLLIENDDLGSIELANMIHPMRKNVTQPMEVAVSDAIRQLLPYAYFPITVEERNSSIKIARGDVAKKPRFVIIPRKRLFAYDEASSISVVKRSTFMLDLFEIYRSNHVDQQRQIRQGIERALVVQSVIAENGDNKDALNTLHPMHEQLLVNVAASLDRLLLERPDDRPQWLSETGTSLYGARASRLSPSRLNQ